MQSSYAAIVETGENAGEAAEEMRARANLYRLLAGAFIEEPGGEYLAALRSPAARDALAALGVSFDADFTDTPPDVLEEALACEYAALFTGPGSFPPVESVRLTGRFQQENCFAVREVYRRAGFAVQPGRFSLFDDQLGVELLYVAMLLERAADALVRGDDREARHLEKEIRRFWANHLGRWVRGYASLLERAAEHSFYREMARLLRGFAGEELAFMALRVDDVDGGREVVPKSEISVLFDPDEPVCNACEPGGKS